MNDEKLELDIDLSEQMSVWEEYEKDQENQQAFIDELAEQLSPPLDGKSAFAPKEFIAWVRGFVQGKSGEPLTDEDVEQIAEAASKVVTEKEYVPFYPPYTPEPARQWPPQWWQPPYIWSTGGTGDWVDPNPTETLSSSKVR